MQMLKDAIALEAKAENKIERILNYKTKSFDHNAVYPANIHMSFSLGWGGDCGWSSCVVCGLDWTVDMVRRK